MEPRIEHFLMAVETFCAHRQMSEARLSTLIFNGGGRLKLLRQGSDIGVRTLARATCWLSDNWPEGAPWPEGLPRPAPTQVDEGLAS